MNTFIPHTINIIIAITTTIIIMEFVKFEITLICLVYIFENNCDISFTNETEFDLYDFNNKCYK